MTGNGCRKVPVGESASAFDNGQPLYRSRSLRNDRAALYLISENRNADATPWPLAKYEAILPNA
jgi:hypothetical protein